MKKRRYIIAAILMICIFLGIYGYYSRKNNVPSKDQMVAYFLEKGENYTSEKLLGYKNTQLIEVWGAPDATLFGMWGDIWEINTEYNLFVYYDSNGMVEQVKVNR